MELPRIHPNRLSTRIKFLVLFNEKLSKSGIERQADRPVRNGLLAHVDTPDGVAGASQMTRGAASTGS